MTVRKEAATRAQDSDADVARHVSRSIRESRQDLDMSISDLAKRSGIAVSTLYKIENDEMVPTVVTLDRVARALGRTPASLLHGDGREAELEHICSSRADRFTSETGFSGWVVAGGLPGGRLFSAVLEVTENGQSGRRALCHTGEELIVCIKGRLEVTVGSRKFVLQRGDSLHYKATLEHGFRNLAGTPSRIMYVLTPSPVFRETAWEGHGLP